MHIYSIDNNKREEVTIVLVLVSCVVTFVLNCIIPCWKDFVYSVLFADSNLAQKCDFIIENVVVPFLPFSVYGILSSVYNKILWKAFQWWHHVPDLTGEWKMQLFSSMKLEERQIDVSIKQNWKKISIQTHSVSGTMGKSNAATIELEHDKIHLRYAFTIQRCSDYKACYEGFNTLEYDDKHQTLKGDYFSEKSFTKQELRKVLGSKITKDDCQRLQDGVGSKGTMNWERKKKDNSN